MIRVKEVSIDKVKIWLSDGTCALIDNYEDGDFLSPKEKSMLQRIVYKNESRNRQRITEPRIT